MSNRIQIVVQKDEGASRLDLYLAETLKFLSRTRIKTLIEQGKVLVNLKSVKPSFKLKPGDKIELIIPEAEPVRPQPEPIPLKILYEDKDIIVIDKPAGLLTHPTPGKMSGTLVNALLYHCQDLSGIGGELKPGIVHRLDKLTSGVMVVAKSDLAHRRLAEQFKQHTIERAYLALVWGNPPQSYGRIESKIGRNPRHRLKMTTKAPRGRIAITEWRVMKRFKHFSLLECQLHTGRTHQIRVHLSELGYPVVGDALYGRGRFFSEKLAPEIKNALKDLKQHALHAYKLGFKHPLTGASLLFTSPFSSELNSLVKLLEKFD